MLRLIQNSQHCRIKGIPCDPRRRECAHYLTNEWRTNDGISSPIDMQWRATRTERHVLNYFVYFTAPQMAGCKCVMC